jgi:ribosomal-protein-alanine N-acetyltransferase
VIGVCLDRATTADVAALAELEAVCFSHPWTPGQIAGEIEHGPPGAVLVLRHPAGGRLLPCAACAYRVVADEMHILDLAVAPDWRRRGLARFLLRTAIRRAVRAGARRALLEVRAGNREAALLYLSLGFERRAVRRGYYREPTEDAILLEREGLAEPGRPLQRRDPRGGQRRTR